MEFEKIVALVAERKDLDPSQITPESDLTTLGLDSLDVAELVMELEDAFDVSIDLDEGVKTVNDLISRIEEAKKA